MHVVERHPTGTPTSPFHSNADSDDEPTSSAGNLSPRLGNDSSGGEDRSSLSNDLSDDESLEEGFDIDIAKHQREIALEYYEKRHAIGAETAKAMDARALDDHPRQESVSPTNCQAFV